MKKEIYILLTVEVAADGDIDCEIEKFENIYKAHAYGRKRLCEWMSKNEMIDDCNAEACYDGRTCRINTYGSLLVEAIDNMSIARFEYFIRRLEV